MKFRMLTIISVVFFVIISAGLAKGNNELDTCCGYCILQYLECLPICASLPLDRRTPCEERCKYEQDRCMRLCYIRNKQPKQPKRLNDDLIDAAKIGDIYKVKELISKGADVNAKAENGRTTLMFAALKGYKDICKLLISKDADVNAKAENGRTALMCAASNNHKDICKLLISKDADVNAKNKDGETALMLVAFQGHRDICELLISKGADVNAKDKDGWTALKFAAIRGHKDIVELLKRHGAKE